MVEPGLANKRGLLGWMEACAITMRSAWEWGSRISSLLAKAYAITGRFDEGLKTLAEALCYVNDHEEATRGRTHRVKGELLLKQNPSNVVEPQNCFERAIEIARKQSAR